jgi:heme-degrading monooxygenase HmoA
MVVVLFRSRLTDRAGDEYAAAAEEMLARARTMPGFVDFKSFRAPDGERLSVIHWESQDSMRAWAEDVRHRTVQARGRSDWYREFTVEVAEVARRYGFERD